MLHSETMLETNDKFVSNFLKIKKRDLSYQGLVIQKSLGLAEYFFTR